MTLIRDLVANAADLDALRAAVRGTSLESLAVRDAERIGRRLVRLGAKADFRLLAVGNHTLDGFASYLPGAALARGFVLACDVAPFGQHMNVVLDPAVALEPARPDAILLSLTLEGILEGFPHELALMSPAAREGLVEKVLEHLAQWVALAKERTEALLMIGNFWRPIQPCLGLADARLRFGETEIIQTVNARLAARFAEDPQVVVLDLDHALARAGRDAATNPKMAFLAKIAWDDSALPALADPVIRHISALVLPPRKCLVLDLDNTLWGGVVGEEGTHGVKVGEGDPVGEAFLAFQRAIKAIQRRGFLLALCSKNNLDDAREVFEQRSEMPLRWDDFAAVRINWLPKHDNIQAIARELNIGVDSLVFVDDNPAECELVRQMLPEVLTVQLPRSSSEYASLLLGLPELERVSLTDEDLRKTEQYKEQAEREASLAVATDMASYLESLETRLTMWPATRAELVRVHQLFSKTNQFNLTTIRYKPADIERFLASPDWHLEVVSARDRFGDLGIIGVFLLEFQESETRINSLLLSCRAMGRGVETAITNRIKALARERTGQERLTGLFRPTRKNKPVVEFYPSQGFRATLASEDGATHYTLALGEADDLPCPGITVQIGDVSDEKRAS